MPGRHEWSTSTQRGPHARGCQSIRDLIHRSSVRKFADVADGHALGEVFSVPEHAHLIVAYPHGNGPKAIGEASSAQRRSLGSRARSRKTRSSSAWTITRDPSLFSSSVSWASASKRISVRP